MGTFPVSRASAMTSGDLRKFHLSASAQKKAGGARPRAQRYGGKGKGLIDLDYVVRRASNEILEPLQYQNDHLMLDDVDAADFDDDVYSGDEIKNDNYQQNLQSTKQPQLITLMLSQ